MGTKAGEGGTSGDNGSCQQQRQEPTGEAIVSSCLMDLRPPFSLFGERALLSMVHSSITDHIDPDGAKCCNSNLPYPMLMKLSGQTNSLLSCVVFEKKVEIP